MQQADETPSFTLRKMVTGFWLSQAIGVAATLGIADLLREGPRSSDELAAATATHPDTLYRLLRTLAAAGVFAEQDNRRFALTPTGECLCSDAADPVRPMAIFASRPYRWNVWGHLLESIQTGENTTRLVEGMSTWEYQQAHPEEGAFFDATMTAHSQRHAAAVLAVYDFSRFGTIVDVAGGRGALLSAILARYPQVHGILFEQPHVLANAEEPLRASVLAGRCQLVGGSFFEAVPEGGDAYILKFIIHDWEDDAAVDILVACRRAMHAGAVLLVVERVIGPPNEGLEGKLSDLNMLTGPGGRERTLQEFELLFGRAGLRLLRVTATSGEVSIIEATGDHSSL